MGGGKRLSRNWACMVMFEDQHIIAEQEFDIFISLCQVGNQQNRNKSGHDIKLKQIMCTINKTR